MLLIVNNSRNHKRISQTGKLLKALETYHIPFHEFRESDNIKDLQKQVKGVILTGSPMKMSEKNYIQDLQPNILAISSFDVPFLGICFGCQLLFTIHGGKIKNVGKYNCVDMPTKLTQTHPLFITEDATNQQDTRPCFYCFSDLTLSPSPKNINIKQIAWFDFNGKPNTCGFEFPNKKYALLFHPESRLDTHFILQNFAKLCNM
jgi:anthranilate/para-aminobenzoate synthase component II